MRVLSRQRRFAEPALTRIASTSTDPEAQTKAQALLHDEEHGQHEILQERGGLALPGLAPIMRPALADRPVSLESFAGRRITIRRGSGKNKEDYLPESR